jgi:transcriptional regulator with GAF, ATPase, and Fis domain
VAELGCPKPRLTRAGIAKLENYHWPGNIRELRNVIERAIILSRGGALDFDLPVTKSAMVPRWETAHTKRDAEPEFLTEAELQRCERKNLMTVLEKNSLENQGRERRGGIARSQSHNVESADQKDGVKAPRVTLGIEDCSKRSQCTATVSLAAPRFIQSTTGIKTNASNASQRKSSA